MRNLIWLIVLMVNNLVAQECLPYHKIPKYSLSNNKSAAIGYVACLHARGVVAEVGYDKIFVGLLAMGEGHNGSTYTFLQYEYAIRKLRIYGGPAYRINNNPSLLVGRVGLDINLYDRLWLTTSILQVNPDLNYLHTGLKLIL